MSYIAKHYVNIAGHTYTPGEIIDAIPDGKEKRLLKIGAVIDNGDNAPIPPYEDNEAPENDALDQEPEAVTDPEPAEEFAEEAEAEEIDATDDILPVSEEPAPEPEKKPRRGGRKA